MRSLLLACLLSLLGLTTAVAQERQLSFDTGGTLFVLTGTANSRFEILPEYPTLIEARLFAVADTALILDVVYNVDGSRVRERVPITAERLQAIRARITSLDLLPVERNGGQLDQSGRSGLLWGSTLWSLFYYGGAASYAVSGESDIAWAFIVAGGAGYLIPSLLTQNAPVSEGAATLSLGGMFQGILHGWALSFLIQGADAKDGRLGAGLSVLGGVTEAVVGYTVGTNTGIEDGHASVINSTAFYGLVVGGLTSAMVFDNVDFSSDAVVRVAGGAGLVGAAAGVLIGNELGKESTWTSGDASVYAVTGLLGATLPIAVITAVQPEDVSVSLAAGLGIAGTVGGLWLGTGIVHGIDYPSGALISLSTVGGALVGVGAAALSESSETAVLLPWLGAAGGFGLALALSDPTIEGSSSMGSLEFDLNPAGPYLLRTDAQGITRPAPFATMRYRF